MVIQYIDIERTWWKKFQKLDVRNKFDIYDFIPYYMYILVVYTLFLLVSNNLDFIYSKQIYCLILDFYNLIILKIQLMHILTIDKLVSLLWKENFKQWCSTIPPISTQQTIVTHLKWTHWSHKKDHKSWLGTGIKMWRVYTG